MQGNQQTTSSMLSAGGSLANEVAKARQHIKQSLQCVSTALFAHPYNNKFTNLLTNTISESECKLVDVIFNYLITL